MYRLATVSSADRRRDRQTDDIIMPIAVQQYDRLKSKPVHFCEISMLSWVL